MIKVLNFQITLFRECLSLKKWYHVLSAVVIFLVLCAGYRFVFYLIDSYESAVLLISSFLYCFIYRLVFPKDVDVKCNNVRIFFPLINVNKYRTFLYYNKYIAFEAALLYLLVPYKISDIPFFIIIITVLHIFMYTVALVRRFCDTSTYNFVLTTTIIAMCLLTLLYNRNMIKIPDVLYSNILFLCGCLLITIILVIQTYRALVPKKDFSRTVFYLQRTQSKKVLIKNRDLLHIIRTNKFIEPIIIILVSATMSKQLGENFVDMISTNMFSFAYLYLYLYVEVLKSEQKTFPLIYSGYSFSFFKKEKIFNCLKIAVPIITLTLIPSMLLTSVNSVVIGLVLSTVMFIINSFLFKISIEKKKGYKIIISEQDHLVLIVINCIEIILTYIILDLII